MSWPLHSIHGKNSPFSNDFQVLTSHTAIPYDAVFDEPQIKIQPFEMATMPKHGYHNMCFFKSHVLLQVRNGKMSTTLSATTLETAFLQDGWFIHVGGQNLPYSFQLGTPTDPAIHPWWSKTVDAECPVQQAAALTNILRGWEITALPKTEMSSLKW